MHEVDKCPVFLAESVVLTSGARWQRSRHALCFVCLKSGHHMVASFRGWHEYKSKTYSCCVHWRVVTMVKNKVLYLRYGAWSEWIVFQQCNLLLTKLWWRRKFSYLAASDSHFNQVAKKQWINAYASIDCGCNGTLCPDALAKKMGCSCSTKNWYK